MWLTCHQLRSSTRLHGLPLTARRRALDRVKQAVSLHCVRESGDALGAVLQVGEQPNVRVGDVEERFVVPAGQLGHQVVALWHRQLGEGPVGPAATLDGYSPEVDIAQVAGHHQITVSPVDLPAQSCSPRIPASEMHGRHRPAREHPTDRDLIVGCHRRALAGLGVTGLRSAVGHRSAEFGELPQTHAQRVGHMADRHPEHGVSAVAVEEEGLPRQESCPPGPSRGNQVRGQDLADVPVGDQVTEVAHQRS